MSVATHIRIWVALAALSLFLSPFLRSGESMMKFVQEEVAQPMRELLMGGAEGNPYYMEELVRMLIDDGVIDVRRQPWRLRHGWQDSARVPGTLAQAKLGSTGPQYLPGAAGAQELDVLQDGGAAVEYDAAGGALVPIDTSAVTNNADQAVNLKPGTVVDLRGGTIAAVDPATGKVWAGRYDPELRTADIKALDPVLPALTESREHKVELRVTEVPLEVAPGLWQTRWTFNGEGVGPTLHGRVVVLELTATWTRSWPETYPFYDRLLREHGHRLVVEDVAAVVEQAVLAVRGEGVERDVGHHAEFGEALLQLAHDAGHQALGVERLAAVVELELLVDHREQRHHRDAELHAVFGHRQQAIQAEALHAGHRAHVLHLVLPGEHEDRQDQIRRGEAVFAHEIAGEAVTAQAAGPRGRVARQLGQQRAQQGQARHQSQGADAGVLTFEMTGCAAHGLIRPSRSAVVAAGSPTTVSGDGSAVP